MSVLALVVLYVIVYLRYVRASPPPPTVLANGGEVSRGYPRTRPIIRQQPQYTHTHQPGRHVDTTCSRPVAFGLDGRACRFASRDGGSGTFFVGPPRVFKKTKIPFPIVRNFCSVKTRTALSTVTTAHLPGELEVFVSSRTLNDMRNVPKST